MRKPSNLGRVWEQGIVGGPDRLVLIESLCRCGTKSQPVQFRSHARVLPIQIESLTRKPGNETGIEFDFTGTMEADEGVCYWVEGWYNGETSLGHLLLRPIFKD